MNGVVPFIDCPTRGIPISLLECHGCEYRVRVLYRDENPPGLQCSRWLWSEDGDFPDSLADRRKE